MADLDGTLQDAHEDLTPEQAATLERLIAEGGFVAIVSGASVESIVRRVGRLVGRPERAGMLFYASNGACCFRMSGAAPEFVYDHSSRFTPLGRAAAVAVAGHCAAAGFGAVEVRPGRAARAGTVCIELTDTQLTLTLAGLEGRRSELIDGLRPIVAGVSGGRLDVRAAGARSVDVCLTDIDKAVAVTHLLAYLAPRGWSAPWDVLILGDSFWVGGADRDLLHPGLRGARVFDAGRTAAPLPDGFELETADVAGFAATYACLDAHLATRRARTAAAAG
ncbi:MAG TPA: HAD hydrolase family protein [Solirubrobacteraceae bacterium]|nr:HAD hydrolase family protein [Solirubrobacteraceae bacterium]